MAYPELAEQGVLPVFDNMMNQHLLKDNLFAFYLTTEAQGVESDLTFGYYDRTKYTGEMLWYPVQFRYMYAIPLDDILINGRSLGVCGPNGIKKDCTVTVDSGTSFMSMPTWAFNYVPQNIPTEGKAKPCQSQEEFGTLTWVIGGKNYEFEATEWIYPPEAAAPQNFKMSQEPHHVPGILPTGSILTQEESEPLSIAQSQSVPWDLPQMGGANPKELLADAMPMECWGTILSMDLKNDMFLVGDIFMRKYYTVFDRQNDRVGIAEAVKVQQ